MESVIVSVTNLSFFTFVSTENFLPPKMIRIAVMLFVLYQVSSLERSYFDLLRGSCYPSDSCASLKKDTEDHLWGNRICECGKHCVRLNTCCMDSPHVSQSWNILHLEETCHKLSNFPNSVLMVTKCSDRWRYEYSIRDQCESLYNAVEDPIMAAPVTNLVTNVTYKNSFCALCNHDYGDDVAVWNIRLELPKTNSPSVVPSLTKQDFLENPTYDKESKMWGVLKHNTFYGMKMRYKLPSVLKKLVKKCYPNMIDKCNTLQQYGYEMQYKCMSYYAPIKITVDDERGVVFYRNIHCAMCNGVNASQAKDTNSCKLDPKFRKTPQPFSFALLLDIGMSDGDLVGKKQLCQDNEIFDPFFKKCRSLVCALPGHVVKDGKCVQI